jgi:carboxypeptidase family protein
VDKKLQFRISALMICCVMLAAFRGNAQNITGSIVGYVSDSSGAAAPGTVITVLNQGTAASVDATVDESGSYTVPNLLAGEYQIRAKKDGFQTVEVKNIQLLSAQTVRQNFTLQPGGVQQTIEVSSQAPLIHTDSQTIGGSLGSKQVSELPLATRSIDGLLTLAPGVSTAGNNPRISGSNYWGGNNFTLNGISVNDVGNGGAAYTSGVPALGTANLPAPDSMQEFRVDSGNQNAEYRDVATVTMMLKQGDNTFHGLAYEYLQNKVLNANQFLLNAAGQPRPDSKFNQFGASLGGPILKNKLFFYGSYRGVRDKFSNTAKLTLPSLAMRNGDFSALCTTFSSGTCVKGTQLYNPFNGRPFVNNQIPAGMIAPQATALLKFLPAPTDLRSLGLPNGSPNYVAAVPNNAGINGVDFRMDGQLSSSDSLNGVFHWSKGSPWSLSSGSYPANYGNNADYGYTDFLVNATETHTFSPTAVNEFRAAWVVHASVRTGQNTDYPTQSLFPQLPIVDNGGLPTMTMTGYTGMFYDYGKGYPFPEYDIEFIDNFTKIAGRHTFKFGADETGYKNYIRQGGPALSASLGNPLGTLTFTGAWTGNKGWPGMGSSQGNTFADFLLGTASTSNYAGPLTEIVTYSRDWEFYAQDTFQVNSKLTLNYGLRYVYQSPWRVRDDRVSFLDLKNNKLALPQDSDTATTPPLAIASLMSAYPFETTKQAGWPKSYFSADTNNFAPRLGFAYRPFSGTRTVIRGGWGIYYNFIPGFIGAHENIFNPPWRSGSSFSSQLPGNPTGPFLPDLTFQNPFPSSVQSGPAANPLIYMTQRNLVNPIMQQWTFTLEQQLSNDWAVRASYIGAQTHHMFWYAGDINKPNIQRPNVPLQAQRPYQPWSQINATQSGGSVNFDQLQLEVNKRFSSGFLVQGNYAFTRSLDDLPLVGGPQNPNNFRAEYGNTDSIPRQVFSLNYLYEIPVGHNRQVNISNRFLDAVIGGWSISGITIYRTGSPFSVSFNVPSSIVGWQGGRADAVSGASIYAGQSGSHDVVNGVQWFNTAAFQAPQPWAWGNSSRNSVYGPGFWNWDLGLQKLFSITEHHSLQLRGDFLNAFNHFNLANPTTGTVTTTIADLRDGGLPTPTAGKILTGTGNPRVIQLGLKYMF